MRRKLNLVTILTLLLPLALCAQHRAAMNAGLIKALEKNSNAPQTISLLVQGNSSLIRKKTKELGGSFKYEVGTISSISLPLNKVNDLALEKNIARIEGLYGNGKFLDDMTFVNANITPVHQGVAPLTQAYDGKGVVMAILDDGIDFRHPDFINADGTTRIKFLWDQTATSGGVVPQPYDYGQEWNADAIDAGTCTHAEPSNEFGHGSNVSGIAAGNGSAVNNFYGVAPATDLIVVAVDMGENFLNNVVDATKYSFDKAAELDEPCVINASIGTYFGSHDGFDLAAQVIDSLIVSQNGRSFVCAVGNAGNIPFHLGYESHPDSSFTWFKYFSLIPGVFFEWWINKKDAADFNFAIGADNIAPFTFLGRTSYFNIQHDFNLGSGTGSLLDTLWNGVARVGIIHLDVYQFDSTYACDVFIQPDNTSDYWRFITNGTGRYDLWSGTTTTGTSDIITYNLPDSNTFHDIVRYKIPDTKETLVSSFTCSDKVIAVANFTNRNQYIDVYGNLDIFTADTIGKLAISSSFGPTRDGRLKPEIAAPGNRTLATGNLLSLAGFIFYTPFKVALGGMHNSNGGTSMASPVVAGIAALYLQKNPTANWREVKDAISLSARKDLFTGDDLPNDVWGYGKADAFAAMTMSIRYGCTDPYSINYDPDATVDNGTCIPVIFGCTDSSALNFNPHANMNDGSCSYISGISSLKNENIVITCFPNPFHSFTNFFYDSGKNSGGRILISDLSGQLIEAISLPYSKGSVNYKNHLQSGLYFYQLSVQGKISKTGKMIVY